MATQNFKRNLFLTLYKVKVKLLSHVRLFAAPWTVAYHTSLSMGFSRQEYWNGLPFSFPEDLPNPGIEPRPPTLKADALPSQPPGKSLKFVYREGEKNITLVCFLLLLKREIKISDTCSLFPLFGDPWPSCLFPSHCVYVMYIRHTNNNIKNVTKFKVK